MNAGSGRVRLGPTVLAALLAAAPMAGGVLALPPSSQETNVLLQTGEPVSMIPTADDVHDFEPLDDEHVMLSSGDKHYLLTLNRECFGLRWARHVGITASDNAIWAGFDALTADGEACPIREIHLVREPDTAL